MSENTAQDLREKARAADKRATESFDRCDTDGFLSQWASNMTARKYRLEADILDDGGKAKFRGLFDEDGNRIKAKTVRTDDYMGYGSQTKWLVLDDDDRPLHWVAIPKTPESPSLRSKMGKLGLHEAPEMATAKAEVQGSGTGMAGAASAFVGVVRTDAGYPEDAIVYGSGK